MKKIAALIGIALVAVITVGFMYVSTPAESETPVKEVVYTVKSGDTLWHIAQLECPDESRDIREVMYEIEQRNNLHGQYLRPSQQIILYKK